MAAEKIGDGTEREALKEKTEPRRAPAGSRHVGDPSLTAPPPLIHPRRKGRGQAGVALAAAAGLNLRNSIPERGGGREGETTVRWTRPSEEVSHPENAASAAGH